MSSFRVTIDGRTTRHRSLQAAQFEIMEALTSLLSLDPAGAAQGVLMAKRAFTEGTVQHALDTRRSWLTTVSVQGRPVKLTIVKRRWL
ncbi:hypothetical protein ACWF94_33760 [Streptomyces sp. NPDC055078]